MMTGTSHVLAHGEAALLAEVPESGPAGFRDHIVASVAAGGRIAALFGLPTERGRLRLLAILARPEPALIELLSTEVGQVYPAITPDCPQAQAFEREIAEQWGVRPEGHPWLKPLRGRVTDFFRVEGAEVHEVGVGPVHAGVIEPGHFRFQCHGERVLHLEIALGYQHRGIERVLVGGPDKRTVHYMETLAGDTTAGHATAYAQALETLAGCEVPPRGQALRAIALELERLANHTGDLAALAADVGYQPTAALCGRLRGEFLNMSASVCGNRLGRGWIRPGGTGFDVEPADVADLEQRIRRALVELEPAVDLLWNTSTVRARFEETGALSGETCRELGLVGPVARASGIPRDARRDHPAGAYRTAAVPLATWTTGDVFARARVRWLEIQHSAAYVRHRLSLLPEGPWRTPVGDPRPGTVAVALVEGWRGEICHVAVTDSRGRFARYKVVDPSFHNWLGLALAMRGQPISDFPLCNKSFNLSYCGHDL
jgi:Ni,Fe-hydrogenase III large subunit